MGVAFSSLTQAQQNQVIAWVDGSFRPTTRATQATRGQIEACLDSALASPSGLPSTFASPAADSTLAVLGSLNAGEIVPVGVEVFPGISPVPVAGLLTNMATLEAVDVNDFGPANEQFIRLVIGPGV